MRFLPLIPGQWFSNIESVKGRFSSVRFATDTIKRCSWYTSKRRFVRSPLRARTWEKRVLISQPMIVP